MAASAETERTAPRWLSCLLNLSAIVRSCSITIAGTKDSVRLPLEVCVRDNGPGVPEDIRSHLFDPFVTTKVSGNGLGLALVAKVVGEHGGIVECDSVPRRTVFRLLLPLQTTREVIAGTEEA